MTEQDATITITLEAREARALIGAANLIGEVFEHLRDDDEDIATVIASGAVSPAQSAAMKLEIALVQAQVAP